MQILNIVTVLSATLLNLAVGAPVEASNLEARADAFFEGWADPNFQGFYKRYDVSFDVCTIITNDFPPGTPGGLTSAKAGPSGAECIIYSNTECDPKSDSDLGGDRLYVGELHQNLADPEFGWSDKTRAFKCKRV